MRMRENTLAIKRISATPTPPTSLRRSPEFAKLVDMSRCIGCKGCEVACKDRSARNTPPLPSSPLRLAAAGGEHRP